MALEAVFFNERAQVCVSVLSGAENGEENEQDAELHCGRGKRFRETH
jgi:hypothetical protein